MSARRLSLICRFGEEIGEPGSDHLERALGELFQKGTLGLAVGHLEEHPNAWLTLGFERGESWTVITVDLYRSGLALLTRYDDQDHVEPAYEYRREGMGYDECLLAWQELSAGAEAKLLTRFGAKN